MDETVASAEPRNLGIRALLMLVMAAAFQLAAWLLLCVAVLQLVLAVATGSSNDRLRAFGRALGRYLGQIAQFVCFGTEDLPFPFKPQPGHRPPQPKDGASGHRVGCKLAAQRYPGRPSMRGRVRIGQ
jgi:hypothetical protein